jgi:hypothetical protein
MAKSTFEGNVPARFVLGACLRKSVLEGMLVDTLRLPDWRAVGRDFDGDRTLW